MESFKIVLFTDFPHAKWVSDFCSIVHAIDLPVEKVIIKDFSRLDRLPKKIGNFIVVDSASPRAELLLEMCSKKDQIFVLVVDEQRGVPRAWLEGRVQEVLVRPLRPLEVLRSLKMASFLLAQEEIRSMSAAFSNLVDAFEEDLEILKRIHHMQLQRKYPSFKKIKLQVRHLPGEQASANYFDVSKWRNKEEIFFFFVQCSTFKLSSVLLTSLVSATQYALRSQNVISKTFLVTLLRSVLPYFGLRDELSLFAGWLSKRTGVLKYYAFGTPCVCYLPFKSNAACFLKNEKSLNRDFSIKHLQEPFQVSLQEKDTLLFLSQGALSILGEKKELLTQFQLWKKKFPNAFFQEVIYKIKESTSGDQLPQDCTLAFFQMPKTRLKLVA